MSDTEELAISIIRRVASLWQIDQDRSTLFDDGFDWWPGHFCVQFRVVEEEGRNDVRVSVRTDFLKDVPIAEDKFIELSAAFSLKATPTYAWIYPPDDFWNHLHPTPTKETPRLQFSSTAYVTEEMSGWLTDFVAGMAIIQPINADIHAKSMQEAIGGTWDVSGPMVSSDVGYDQMTETLELVYGPVGQEPNRWIGSLEFEEFAEQWGRSDLCFGMGDPSGLTLETPLGSGSIMIRLRTNQKHPQLGQGLLGTIQFPFFGGANEIARLSAELNFLESWQWTQFPQNGCWHVVEGEGDQYGLAFSTFVPNALHRPGIATNLAIWLFSRARWARDQKWSDVKDEPMHEIISRRVAAARGSVH